MLEVGEIRFDDFFSVISMDRGGRTWGAGCAVVSPIFLQIPFPNVQVSNLQYIVVII